MRSDSSPTNYFDALADNLETTLAAASQKPSESFNRTKMFKRLSLTAGEPLHELPRSSYSTSGITSIDKNDTVAKSGIIVYLAISRQAGKRTATSPFVEVSSLDSNGSDNARLLARELLRRKAQLGTDTTWEVLTRENWSAIRLPIHDSGFTTSFVCAFDNKMSSSVEAAKATITRMALLLEPMILDATTAKAAPAAESNRSSFFSSFRRHSASSVPRPVVEAMRSILERELATCNTRGGAELADLNSISDDEIKYLQRAANYPDAPRNLIHDALFPTRKKPWLTMWPRIIEFSGPKAVCRCKCVDRIFSRSLAGVELDLRELNHITPQNLIEIANATMSPVIVIGLNLEFSCDGIVLGHLLRQQKDDGDDDDGDDDNGEDDDDIEGSKKSCEGVENSRANREFRYPLATSLKYLRSSVFEGIPSTIMANQEDFEHLQQLDLSGSHHFEGPLSSEALVWLAKSRSACRQAVQLDEVGALRLPTDATELAFCWNRSCVGTTKLDLTNLTCLHGDVTFLTELTSLSEVRLKGCVNIQGSLEKFARLEALCVLDLGGCTSLVGSLASLSLLKKLRYLDIQGDMVSRSSTITGGFSDITEFPELEHLNLNFCSQVRGDLEEFVGLLQLKFIGISSTGATGDANALSHLPLVSIEIYYCPHIFGIGGLKQRSNCRVYGE